MGRHGGQSENEAGVMFGRFMLADMTEHPCRVTDLSIDGVTFLTEVEVGPLSQLVAYIQDVGRVEGRVIGAVPGGIRVAFQLSSTRRQRLESRLKWSQRSGGAADQRRHERFVPKDNKSHITLPDGRVYACEVIDISLSGAAVRTSRQDARPRRPLPRERHRHRVPEAARPRHACGCDLRLERSR